MRNTQWVPVFRETLILLALLLASLLTVPVLPVPVALAGRCLRIIISTQTHYFPPAGSKEAEEKEAICRMNKKRNRSTKAINSHNIRYATVKASERASAYGGRQKHRVTWHFLIKNFFHSGGRFVQEQRQTTGAVLTFSCLKKQSILSSRKTRFEDTSDWKTLGSFFSATRRPSRGSVTALRRKRKEKKTNG